MNEALVDLLKRQQREAGAEPTRTTLERHNRELRARPKYEHDLVVGLLADGWTTSDIIDAFEVRPDVMDELIDVERTIGIVNGLL